MGINPFDNKKDEFVRQTNFEREQHNSDINASTTPEEQMQFQSSIIDPDLTKWQQNVAPMLIEMEHQLRREYEDKNGKWQRLKNMPPLCSDECIENLKAALKPNTSTNLMLTKLDADQICSKLKALEDTVVIDILLPERKKYGTPLSYLSQVKKIFRSFALPTFFRAIGGFEAINQRQVRTVKELYNQGEPIQKKKGFFTW